MQFQPDQEQQQDNADLCDGKLRFCAAHQPKTLRSNQCPRDEIAQHSAKAEAAKQHDEEDRRTQQDDAFGQQEIGCREGRMRRRCGRVGHQASAMRAASATASKLSRIEAWRAG